MYNKINKRYISTFDICNFSYLNEIKKRNIDTNIFINDSTYIEESNSDNYKLHYLFKNNDYDTILKDMDKYDVNELDDNYYIPINYMDYYYYQTDMKKIIIWYKIIEKMFEYISDDNYNLLIQFIIEINLRYDNIIINKEILLNIIEKYFKFDIISNLDNIIIYSTKKRYNNNKNCKCIDILG